MFEYIVHGGVPQDNPGVQEAQERYRRYQRTLASCGEKETVAHVVYRNGRICIEPVQ